MERYSGINHHQPNTEVSPELREYCRQFDAIVGETKQLIAGLSDRQLAWREASGTWSIVDCLDHLLVTGGHSLSGIREAKTKARSRRSLGTGRFRSRLVTGWFVHFMDAPPIIKVKAPRVYRPASDLQPCQVVARFFQLQAQLIAAAEEANGLDLSATRVNNPVSRWFRMTLGQEFAFTAAHERRHLWQAWRVREKLLSSGVAERLAPGSTVR